MIVSSEIVFVAFVKRLDASEDSCNDRGRYVYIVGLVNKIPFFAYFTFACYSHIHIRGIT